MSESCKFCFHLSQGGYPDGIGLLYDKVQGAGRTPYGMVANDVGRANEVIAHGGEVAFRWTGPEFEYLDYSLSPYYAAGKHVEILLSRIRQSPDFNPAAWLVSVNEPDKERSAWLGEASYYIGKSMSSLGYKWLAAGWSGGEPEPDDWKGWEDYIRLCNQYPGQLGIALHEYTFSTEHVNDILPVQYSSPHLIGRFQWLHDFCDANGLQRPPIWITEWGWTHTRVPEPSDALNQMQWAWWSVYAGHPNIKGIAVWYLGEGFDNIALYANRLIGPVGDWLAYADFGYTPPMPEPEPEDYLLPAFMDSIQKQIACGIKLNSAAGLQAAITSYQDPNDPGQWIPVHEEYASALADGDPIQAAENLSSGSRRLFVWRGYWAEVGPAYQPPYG